MANGLSRAREDAVLTLTLDRPQAGNAIDIPMARALLEAAIECETNDEIRCVILTGAGRLYCAGGDVAEFAQAGDALPAHIREITAYLHSAIVHLARMAKPLVVAVNGPVAGAGIGLALIGDIVLADPQSHFTLAYTAIGMSPDGGATWLLPRLIGMRRAQELCLRNSRVSATQAAEIGLITRATEPGRLMAEAREIASELARGATAALGATRQLLLQSLDSPLETQLEAESRSITAQARTSDGREGIAAFIAKRKPEFGGD